MRGRGLLLGLLLSEEGISLGGEIVQRMFQQGVIINFAGNKVLRFAPPLIVKKVDIDAVCAQLAKTLASLP